MAERELPLKSLPRQGQLAHDGGERDDVKQVAAGTLKQMLSDSIASSQPTCRGHHPVSGISGPTDTMHSICTNYNVSSGTCAILEIDRDPLIVVFDARDMLAPLNPKVSQEPVPKSRALCADEGCFGRILFF